MGITAVTRESGFIGDHSEVSVVGMHGPGACNEALAGAGDVFNLAADMPGVGFIGCEPSMPLRSGLEKADVWVDEQVARAGKN